MTSDTKAMLIVQEIAKRILPAVQKIVEDKDSTSIEIHFAKGEYARARANLVL